MKVGDRIAEYRRKAGLTQAQLAEKLDISRQSIQKWESGVCNPELDNLIRLCSIFEVTLDDLVGTGVEPKNTPIFKEDIVEYETFASKPPIDYRKCDTISLILAVAHFASIITTYAIFGGVEGLFWGFGFCLIAIIAYSVIRSKRPGKSAPYVIVSIVWFMAVSGGLSHRNFLLASGIGFLITLPYSISLFLLHHPAAAADPRSTAGQTYRSGTQDTSRPYLQDASGPTAKSVSDPSIRKSQILTAKGYVDLAKHHLSNGARKAAMRELEDCLTYYPRHAPAILSLLLAKANCQNEEALFRSRYNVSGDPLWERLLQNETPERVEYLKQAEANRLAFVAQQDAYAAEVARKNALLAEEKRKENLYRNALESVRYQDYKGAVKCLERIAPYRDSEKLIQEYRYLAAVLRPNKFHRISTYKKHIALLRELGDYKDSVTLAQTYETEIQRKKEAQKKRRKRAKIAVLATTGAALVITGATFLIKDVIVPNVSYSQAQSLWEQGRYEEAAERFSSFGSYKDAETMARLSKAGACFKKNDYQEGIKIICEAGGKVAIKYDPNGGSCFPSTEILYKGKTSITRNVARKGYSFLGWEIKSYRWMDHDCELTLAARWSLVQYSLSFNLNGGRFEQSNSLPRSYNVESEDIVIPDPVRYCYIFEGWKEPKGIVYQKSLIPTGSVGDRSYAAYWKAIKNTITLDGNGAALEQNTITAVYDQPLTLPTPERAGYHFDGWFLGNEAYYSGKTWTKIVDSTLTASWTPIQYVISYDLAGGSSSKENQLPQTYTVETESFTIPEPVKEGHTFVGWTGSNGDNAEKVVEIPTGTTEAFSFVANWEANHYAVDLDASGGTVSEPAVDATFGEALELPAPTRDGYRFAGWDLDGEIVSSGDIWGKDNDAELIAKWTPIEYQISYDLSGGSLTKGEEMPKNYTIETETFAVPEPVKKGYTFLGWTGSNGNVPQIGLEISTGTTGDLSFVANWETNHYAVDLDASGGTVSESAADATYGESLVLPAPERKGYRFDGWVLDGGIFSSGDIWDKDCDAKLTAKWIPIEYQISYDLASGSFAEGEALPKTYTVESNAFSIPDPTREGFTFHGWTGSNGDVPQTGITVASGTTGSLSFLANWKANEYTLTVKNGGALDDLASKFMAGEPISEPSQYKSLYCCEEYYSDAEMTRPMEWPLTAYGDVTVYAKWTQTISSLFLSYAYDYQNYLTFDGDEIIFHVYGITWNNMDVLNIHSNVSGTVTFLVSATNNPNVFYGIREQDPAYSYKLQGYLGEDPKEISFQVEENKDYVIMFQDKAPDRKSDIVIKGLVLAPYKQVLFRDDETDLGTRYLAKGKTLDLTTVSLSQIGREFKGFYYDEALTQKAEGEIVVKTDMVLYTEWEVLFDIDFGGWVYESVGSYGYAYHSARGKVDSITITFAKAGTLSLEIYPIYSQQSVSVYDPDTGKKYLGATCGMTFLGDWVSGKFDVEAGQTIIIKTVPKGSYGDALMRNLLFIPQK